MHDVRDFVLGISEASSEPDECFVLKLLRLIGFSLCIMLILNLLKYNEEGMGQKVHAVY